jgi:hypothetical protein
MHLCEGFSQVELRGIQFEVPLKPERLMISKVYYLPSSFDFSTFSCTPPHLTFCRCNQIPEECTIIISVLHNFAPQRYPKTTQMAGTSILHELTRSMMDHFSGVPREYFPWGGGGGSKEGKWSLLQNKCSFRF